MQHLYQFNGRLLDIGSSGCRCCSDVSLTISEGKISLLQPHSPTHSAAQPSTLLMPPFANGHDHLRGVRPISLGAYDLPLELWLTSMTNIPKVDPYLVATTALGRQALGGLGTIMIHYTRPNDANDLPNELDIVARAAEKIGVRVAIAVSLRDRNPLGYGPNEEILQGLEPADRQRILTTLVPSFRTPKEQVQQVEELAAQIESPLVTVQYGPYGVEWCSDALLREIAERSALTGRRVHMHLLESPIQREYLDYLYPQGPISFLQAIGMLSPRLSVAHAVWLRPDEMEMLAANGVTVATNASSNLSLRSGVPPVAEMFRRGVPLAIGMDGFSFDDDDDAFREIRLNYMLHRGTALEAGLSLDGLLSAACYGGRASVAGLPHNKGIVAGSVGDLMELDYALISSDIPSPSDEANVVVHRATSATLKRMIVMGNQVVDHGTLVNVDLAAAERELSAQVRHYLPMFRSWQEVSARLGAQLKRYYQSGMHRGSYKNP